MGDIPTWQAASGSITLLFEHSVFDENGLLPSVGLGGGALPSVGLGGGVFEMLGLGFFDIDDGEGTCEDVCAVVCDLGDLRTMLELAGKVTDA